MKPTGATVESALHNSRRARDKSRAHFSLAAQKLSDVCGCRGNASAGLAQSDPEDRSAISIERQENSRRHLATSQRVSLAQVVEMRSESNRGNVSGRCRRRHLPAGQPEVFACTHAAVTGYVWQARAHSGPVQDVPRGIQISVDRESAVRALVMSIGECFRHSRATVGTFLSCVI